MATTNPHLCVIALGGTIASVPSDSGGASPSLTSADLIKVIPDSIEVEITTRQQTQVPSGDLKIADLLELATFINENAPNFDGFVVTQGTDTLEESSYLLDLTVDPQIPVAMTGAMRHPGLPGADGPANLVGAVQVAASGRTAGLGPVVVFADEIHLARHVHKRHSTSIAAFTSPNAGPIGWVIEDRVRINLRPDTPSPRFAVEQLGPLPRVGIITLGLGSLPEDLPNIDHWEGAVAQLFGGGHSASYLAEALGTLGERIPVVMTSRTGAGELLRSTYGFPGSEVDLLERGIISAQAHSALKARLLLTLALANGADRDEVSRLFESA